MATLIQTFDKYASSEGKRNTLNKAEAAKNPDDVDKMLKGLDCNGDAEVDFKEFVLLIATMTCGAHNRFCTQW
ncbi:hypothetical protein GOODEAATRI_002870 [Goodea atripinnis]|uniref:EF-hand domain-containing protein n=1 Tax=Goodea atripinnis TaxID=208336 RepID=A0ABV0MEX9_9TELE